MKKIILTILALFFWYSASEGTIAQVHGLDNFGRHLTVLIDKDDLKVIEAARTLIVQPGLSGSYEITWPCEEYIQLRSLNTNEVSIIRIDSIASTPISASQETFVNEAAAAE